MDRDSMRGLGRPLERDREAGKCHALPLVRSAAQRPVGMPATAGRSKAISRHNPTSIPAPEDNSQSPVGGGRSTQPSRDRRADSPLEILTEPAGSSVSLLIAFVVPVSGDCQPTQQALDLRWFTPDEAISEEVRREMTGGHDRLIRLALAHVGQLP